MDDEDQLRRFETPVQLLRHIAEESETDIDDLWGQWEAETRE